MKPEEVKKCGNCKNRALKRTVYCILCCENYDKHDPALPEGVKNGKL